MLQFAADAVRKRSGSGGVPLGSRRLRRDPRRHCARGMIMRDAVILIDQIQTEIGGGRDAWNAVVTPLSIEPVRSC